MARRALRPRNSRCLAADCRKPSSWARDHVPLPEDIPDDSADPQHQAEQQEDIPDDSADPQHQAEQQEWAARLWAAVNSLQEPDRTLFIRYYYQEEKLKSPEKQNSGRESLSLFAYFWKIG